MNHNLSIELASRQQEAMVRQVVSETLAQLGLDSALKNYSECRALYGKWFTDHVKSGVLRGVKQGNRIMYSVAAINARMATESRLAAERERRAQPDII